MKTYGRNKSVWKAALAAVMGLLMSMLLLAGCASDKVETSSSSSADSSSMAASASTEADSESADSDSGAADEEAQLMVTVEIDPSAAAGKTSEDIDPTVFGPEEVFVQDGGTAYDALLATGVKVEGDPSYVTSIDGLANGAVSSTSGWMYSVNGETPMVAANDYKVSEGDRVLWYYVDSFE